MTLSWAMATEPTKSVLAKMPNKQNWIDFFILFSCFANDADSADPFTVLVVQNLLSGATRAPFLDCCSRAWGPLHSIKF